MVFPFYLKPSKAEVGDLWQCNATFWLTFLAQFVGALLQMLKVCIYAVLSIGPVMQKKFRVKLQLFSYPSV